MARIPTLKKVVMFTPSAVMGWMASLIAKFDTQHVTARIEAGDEDGSSVRRFTVQVVDRLTNPVRDRFPVRFTVGTADTGAPAGTQTVSVVTGATVQTVAANQCIDLMTDAAGLAEVDVTVTGAGTRYVRATIGAESTSSGAVAWT